MADLTKLARAHATVANTLGDLAKLFTPDCRLTFVMRDPTDAEAFMVVSDDEVPDIIAVLERSSKRPVTTLAAEDVVKAGLGL